MSTLSKYSLLAVLFLLSYHQVRAQDLMHSLGVKMSILSGKVYQDEDDYSDVLIQVNEFEYFPRYNLLKGENASISIGLPLGVGVGISRSSDGGDVGLLLAFDAPIAIDFNFGDKSTPDSDRNFGEYFGFGFGYSNVRLLGSSYSDFEGSVYGPLARAGVRFGGSSPGWNGHALDLGLYYKYGLGTDRLFMAGLNILYAF